MDAMAPTGEHRIETARLRRAPRYGVFIGAGVILAVIVAAILTAIFDGTQDKSVYTGVVYTWEQVFGFLLLVSVPVGIAAGGVVALVFDRALGRRSREVRVDRETVVEDDDQA